jgi:hypothetical protein
MTIVAGDTQKCFIRIVELHATLDDIRILSVAQQCFFGEFMSPATVKRT